MQQCSTLAGTSRRVARQPPLELLLFCDTKTAGLWDALRAERVSSVASRAYERAQESCYPFGVAEPDGVTRGDHVELRVGNQARDGLRHV